MMGKLGPLANIIAAISIVITVLTTTVGAYVVTRQDIAVLAGRVAQHDYQIVELKNGVEGYHKEQLDYQNEMRGQVAHAVDILTDVRMQLAKFHAK